MDRTPTTQPQFVQPGVPLSARTLNQGIELAHADAMALRRGQYIEDPLGYVPLGWVHDALIVQVEPTPEQYEDGLLPFPDDVYYWIVRKGVPGSRLDRVRPSYGRPATGRFVRIRPAAVGDTCGMVVIPTDTGRFESKMLVWTEEVARRRCNGAGGVPPPPVPGSNNPNPGTRPYGPPRNTDPSSTPSSPVY